MPMSQTWSYMKTHISSKIHIGILWFIRAFGYHNSIKTISLT
ncbi:hypothetical protein F383_35270 [Gossypium arboreum]|uniref:Uncharacterized protein n=1 Tax=Gossypium arboreum TaxID=29729 RepID=A0A0B0N5G2_GOSAR|nr:hypothetical protein F383_35270 [Gossypium arboreum]